LAYHFINDSNCNDDIVEKQELDELRSYVRQGKPDFIWPVNIRRIYDANHQFSDELDPVFQVLHEWDILFIPNDFSKNENEGEFYVVVAILGVEYVINLGGPELDGYIKWLEENKGRSCLYIGKNA
jgi:hypothetical protein